MSPIPHAGRYGQPVRQAKREHVRLVQSQRASTAQVAHTETRTETQGALALLDLDLVDTQPLPALPTLRPVAARHHILIVEDDTQVAGVIREALELEGEVDWEVQTACEGTHALELATSTPPDLVLLDVWLPGLDGAEVYHRLRANAGTRGARILFLSAATSFDLYQRGIEDGVLLRKPFDVPQLVSLVRALLRG